MNLLEFVASIIESLAWPLVFLLAFTLLRQPIKDLLPFLQRLKYKELEVEFNRRVEEVRAEVVEELPAPSWLPRFVFRARHQIGIRMISS